ncbi:MAG: bifunctional UDP-sugar hydrolase/5'-nucleotidase [Candidatus Euphemobacter frigidus]|nr:bifunctional UDP-sugar hydrolase/5'-nucleotidase [Candidatus Euphemobacter frigidus]MDP8275276.1 bifunctional UDP-sugar hydrolase/5'-nucleotidase [Candidatus Euphemobacter frigidus]
MARIQSRDKSGLTHSLLPATRGLFIILIILAMAGCGGETSREITIVYTNDLHGHLLSERIRDWPGQTGGYAVFAGWFKEIRRKNKESDIPTLLLDGGDIFTGTVEGNLTKGATVVRLMNLLNYDAMALGNHELDFGFHNLEHLSEEADFPFLSANVFQKKTGKLLSFVRPYIIKNYEGLVVGIIGATTDEVPSITLTRNVGSLIFKDPVPEVEIYQKLLRREGVDLLIVLSHLGLEEDKKLARAVPEIDLIIGGHSHDLLPHPLRAGGRGTLICQAGSYGRFAGRLDIHVDTAQDKIAAFRSKIFTNSQFNHEPDIEIDYLLKKVKFESGEEYDREIGIATGDILSGDKDESPLGDLITDAVRAMTGAEAAFQNPYGIRGDLLEGPITRRDIFRILPFDDNIITMELTGREIRELLEQSLTLQKGLLQISGLRVTYDMRRTEGNRVRLVEIGGKALEDRTRYIVATNEFLAGGGDYFQAFRKGENRRDTGILLRKAVGDYIREHGPIYPRHISSHRWVNKSEDAD